MKTIKFLLVVLVSFNLQLFAQIDRTKAPVPAPAPAINIADYQSFVLPNGLTVFVVENHKLPVVSLQLVVNYDPIVEKPNSGYVSAAGALLRTGTKTKNKAQIDNEIDKIGATLSTSETGLYASALKKHVQKLFSLASEIVVSPVFTQAELDKIKEQMLSEYQSSKEEPQAIASVVRRKLLYGESHPFSESVNENSIKNINLDLVNKFYQTYFRPNVSYLAIVGDISLKEAKKLVERNFSNWQKQDVPSVEYRKPAAPLVNKVVIVDRPNAVQSTINISYPVDLYPGSADALTAKVANTILGGGTFRLFNNLREKRGFTYGAYSQLESNRIVGFFNASANTRNAVTDSAVTEFLYEMKRITEEPVPASELSMIKNYMTGGFAISLESPQTVANFAINTARYKLAPDYYKNYLKNLAAVSAEDVQKVAKKYILPEQSYILVVGKAEEVADKLKPFSVSGKVDFYDTDGNKIDVNAAKVPEGITVEKIIENHINALGGKESLEKIKDRTLTMSGTIQGMELVTTIYQKAPAKFLGKVSVSGMEQVIFFDGEKGEQRSVMGNNKMTEAESEEFKFSVDMTSLCHLGELGVTAKLTGMIKVKDADAYKVEYKLPKGSTIIDYYDAKSFLRVRQDRTLNTPNGTFTQSTEFSDYRELQGVKFAFAQVQSVMGRSIEMKVSKMDVNTGLSDELFK